MVTAYAGPVREFVVYTALRIAVFLASVLVVLGVWTMLADTVPVLGVLVVAVVVSGIASYFLLNRQREAFARRVQGRAERMQERFEQMKAKEDAD